jgi:hypothetical protein
MSVPLPLFHAVSTRISTVCLPLHLRRTSVERLAVLVTGMMAAQSCVISRMAQKVESLGLTCATQPDSVARRLRRTLGDRRLVRRTYEALLAQVVPWEQLDQVVLILDESSKRAHLHLLRVSLAYRGAVVPLAWSLWQQQQPLPECRYWREMDLVLERVARLLPSDVDVLLLADRAYDVPPLIDRLTIRNWHWIIRCKGKGTIRFRDRQGQETGLAERITQHVPTINRRWKARGWLFKKAGWREASVVALWAAREEEPLVVISDLPPRWDLLRTYAVRAWIEPGFRQEKSRGWQWEACQVPSLAHQQTLLLAMAWASMLTLLLGSQEAAAVMTQVTHRDHGRPPRKPHHARYSLFSLGLHAIQRWIDRHDYRILPRGLPPAPLLSWTAQWYGLLARAYIFQSVRP